ncbi:sulfatase-like hydrolase/transferase [Aliarcobacter skirrowii]|uniref:sulfatase-like hydrolase/transferase n=1 Tax=Aliarcobacter skirrowii TaxID=28200 RepID=UPI002243C662|nr:sulfatase-like hydrolase/transferase [Aliarcobacter skirrowii]
MIIMLDSVRWNMVDEITTPNIHKLKQESITFENHFSGGNSTRFGVFSFFYGLNAPYWFSFLDEQKSSVLFDALEYRDFDIRIFASSDLN